MKKENMNELNKKVGFDVSKMKEAADNGKLDEFERGKIIWITHLISMILSRI